MNNPALIYLKFWLLHLLQNSVQARQITALLSVSLSLGPSMAVNISHWCLFRFWLAFADSWLVWLPSWVGGLLSTSSELVEGRGLELSSQLQNKIKNSQFSALSFATLCCTVKCGQPCMQMNSRKLVMRPETDTGSELPLTSFNWCHPPWPGSFQSSYIRDRANERLLKAFN